MKHLPSSPVVAVKNQSPAPTKVLYVMHVTPGSMHIVKNVNSSLYDVLAESSCSCTKYGCLNYTNLSIF